MKKTILSALLMLVAFNMTAQENFYICEKFDSDGFKIADLHEFQFNDDKTEFTIDGETYEVADIDSIVFTKPSFPAVTITWNGTSATVDIDPSIKGVTYTVNGAHVNIVSKTTTDEYLYVLQGSSTNGSLTLTGSYKLTMHLNGVNLISQKGAALDIECGKRVELKMMKDTENTFADASSGAQKAALYCKGHLEIKGKGTLNVTGNTKHAICAKEYLMLKSSTGTINILGAKSDGMHCGVGSKLAADAEDVQFIMKGGTVNMSNCQGDCIDSDDYGIINISGGTLNLEVNQTDGAGVKADSVIYMTGGDINLNVTGNISQGLKCGWDAYFDGGTITGNISGQGAKGIKANKASKTTSTVKNGGDAHFRGTEINLTVSGDIYTTDLSKCMGIRVDKDMYISGGDIHVTVQNANAYGVNVISNLNQSDGNLHITLQNGATNGLVIGASGQDNKTGGTRVID